MLDSDKIQHPKFRQVQGDHEQRLPTSISRKVLLTLKKHSRVTITLKVPLACKKRLHVDISRTQRSWAAHLHDYQKDLWRPCPSKRLLHSPSSDPILDLSEANVRFGSTQNDQRIWFYTSEYGNVWCIPRLLAGRESNFLNKNDPLYIMVIVKEYQARRVADDTCTQVKSPALVYRRSHGTMWHAILQKQ